MSTIATVAAIELLKESLSSTAFVVTPTSEDYEESIKRWATTAERRAAIVVFPTTAEDVSKAVLFSKANNLELAIKGGGHATSGSSSTEGGLCIDLDKMRGVSVDTENKTVTAQGGALWEDVDIAAAKHGLACVGGTVNHTGIGGLTLGGGYGFLTGEYGLVIDNLLSLEYVLADGTIVTASDTDNQDLYWAARGAGVGFGVATSFTYRAHEQKNPVWGGIIIFPKTELENIIKFANSSLEVPSGKHTMLVGFSAPPPAGLPVVMAMVVYNGAKEEAKDFYAPLLELNAIANLTQVMPYDKVNTVLNAGLAPGSRRTMKGSAFKAPLSPSYALSLFNDFESFLQRVPDAAATVILLEYVSYNKIIEVEQTAMAFANRGAYGNLLFAPGWMREESDTQCREWSREIARKTRDELMRRLKEEETDSVTKTGVGEYVNYDSLNSSAEIVFGVNYPRLKGLKKQYDPSNVFCKGPNLLI